MYTIQRHFSKCQAIKLKIWQNINDTSTNTTKKEGLKSAERERHTVSSPKTFWSRWYLNAPSNESWSHVFSAFVVSPSFSSSTRHIWNKNSWCKNSSLVYSCNSTPLISIRSWSISFQNDMKLEIRERFENWRQWLLCSGTNKNYVLTYFYDSNIVINWVGCILVMNL